MSYPDGPHIATGTPTLLQILELRGSESMTQSVAWDPPYGEVYMARAVDEDTYIIRFPAGVFNEKNQLEATRDATMVCVDAGHGSTISCVRRSETEVDIVMPWNIWVKGRIIKRSVALVPFADGKRTSADVRLLSTFTTKYAVMALDQENALALIRSTGSGTEAFEVRLWEDIQTGKNDLLGKITTKSLGTFQGCTISGSSVYAIYGETNAKADWDTPKPPTYLYEWDWTTGKLLTKRNVTTAGRIAGERPRMSEPESVNVVRLNGTLVLVAAFKMGSGKDGEFDEREVRLVALTPLDIPQETLPMRASVSKEWYESIKSYEGFTRYMYFDTHKPPLATVGIGNMIDTGKGSLTVEGMTLPWKKKSGALATQAEIAAEYKRLKALGISDQGGYAYAKHASLLLDEPVIKSLVARKTSQFFSTLKTTFSDIDEWPADAQLAIMNMAWWMGPAFTKSWPNLTAALKAQDWLKAAENCTTVNPSARNPHNARRFTTAAMVVALKKSGAPLYDEAVVDVSAVAANTDSVGSFYVQRMLELEGLYTLKLDGDFGPRSEAALTAYAKKIKLAPHSAAVITRLSKDSGLQVTVKE